MSTTDDQPHTGGVIAHPELSRDDDGDVSLDWSVQVGPNLLMLSISVSPAGELTWAAHQCSGTSNGKLLGPPEWFTVLDAVLRNAEKTDA